MLGIREQHLFDFSRIPIVLCLIRHPLFLFWDLSIGMSLHGTWPRILGCCYDLVLDGLSWLPSREIALRDGQLPPQKSPMLHCTVSDGQIWGCANWSGEQTRQICSQKLGRNLVAVIQEFVALPTIAPFRFEPHCAVPRLQCTNSERSDVKNKGWC